MALLYDTFLVLPVVMFAVVLGMAANSALNAALGGPGPAEPLNPWAVRGLSMLVLVGFFSAFWTRGGQTLGMQAWRIRLQPLPGRELTAARCALRCLAAMLSAACFGLGYLWCLIDRRGRYWHDYLSGSVLVLVPGNAKKT
jgi:uncharacterized RDD family membrane protein YckC